MLAGRNPSSSNIRLFIRYQAKDKDLLVDSGSVICVEPASPGLRATGLSDLSLRYNTFNNKGAVKCYKKYDRMVVIALYGKMF